MMNKTLYRNLALALGASLLLPQAALALDKLPKSLARLAPGEVMSAIEIKDDNLEPHVSFSSQPVHKVRVGLPGDAWSDTHISAELDRASGKVAYRVWNEMVNHGAPKELARVHFSTQGQHRASDLSLFRQWQDNCVPAETGGQCDQHIRVAFDLPEQVLREVAASYDAGKNTPWRYRLKDAHGRDVTGALAPAEVAGLIQAVDAYKGRAD